MALYIKNPLPGGAPPHPLPGGAPLIRGTKFGKLTLDLLLLI